MPSILESLTNLLGQGDTLEKLGSVMGGDADQAAAGVAAAGPALLGALAENAATDTGAQPVSDLVDSVGPSILDDVDGFIDGDETEVGTGVLDALFGQDRSELLSGLSSEGVVSSGSFSKLLPVLAPLVLGAVAKRKADDDLDLNALATVLTEERGALEDDGSLGEWFGRTLAGGGAIAAVAGVAAMARNRIGGGDKVGDAASGAADNVGDAAGGAIGALTGRGGSDDDDDDGGEGDASDDEPTTPAGADDDEARKRPGWFWWAVGAVILVLLLAWLLSRGTDDDGDGGSTATTSSSSDADDSIGTDAGADGSTDGDGREDGADDGDDGGAGDGDAGDAGSGDAGLAASVEVALAEAGFGESVSVSVSGGVVTLSGVVGSAADVEAVAGAVAGLDGVGEVVNEVTADGDAGAGEDGADDGDDGGAGASDGAGTSLNEELGLTPITFEYRSAVISADSEVVLAEVVTYLEANEVDLVIEGHTDSDGTTAENEALGQRRADAVSELLQAAGIEAGRLEAVGIGETDPKVPNNSLDAKAQNRRIELVIAG